MNLTKIYVLIVAVPITYQLIKDYILYSNLKKSINEWKQNIENLPLSKTLHTTRYSIGYSVDKDNDKDWVINSMHVNWSIIIMRNPNHRRISSVGVSKTNDYSGFIVDARPNHIEDTNLFIKNIQSKKFFS